MARKNSGEQGSLFPTTAAPAQTAAAAKPKKPRVKKVMAQPVAAQTLLAGKGTVKVPKSIFRAMLGAGERLNKVNTWLSQHQ